MHAKRCEISLKKVLLKIVANLQKDRFHKKGFIKNKFFLRKSFEIFWKIMATSSKGFYLNNEQWDFSQRFLVFFFFENYNENFFSRFWKRLQWKFLSKVLKKNTMEVTFQGFENNFWKRCTNRVPSGVPICLPVFLVNKYRLVLIIKRRAKPEILGYVVHFVVVRSSSS